MTREEIEKAIKNGESVWVNGIEHKLDKYYFVAEYNNEPTLYLMTCGYEEDDWNNYPVEAITNIYKTKAKAEHHLHHANISRIEELPFLTWEEFLEKKDIRFYTKDGDEVRLYITDDGNKIYVMEFKPYGYLGKWNATEANFYKAYDECVRLFRSEE